MAPGEDPCGWRSPAPGGSPSPARRRASGSSPGHPGDVTIRFKSPDDAFRVFTGQIGIAQAYAQHRFTLRGNMGLAMPLCAMCGHCGGVSFPRGSGQANPEATTKKEISTARVYLAVLFGR